MKNQLSMPVVRRSVFTSQCIASLFWADLLQWYFHRAPIKSADTHRSSNNLTGCRGGTRKVPSISNPPELHYTFGDQQLLCGGILVRSLRELARSFPGLLLLDHFNVNRASSLSDLIENKDERSNKLFLRPVSKLSSTSSSGRFVSNDPPTYYYRSASHFACYFFHQLIHEGVRPRERRFFHLLRMDKLCQLFNETEESHLVYNFPRTTPCHVDSLSAIPVAFRIINGAFSASLSNRLNQRNWQRTANDLEESRSDSKHPYQHVPRRVNRNQWRRQL